MGAVVEVAYFNTYLLRNVGQDQVNVSNSGVVTPNSPAIADNGYKKGGQWPSVTYFHLGYPKFPLLSTNLQDKYEWYVEESRIRGGFNNTSVELGPRAYLTEQNDSEDIFPTGLIYSGVFNSKTDINNTNVFSVADEITKSLDPRSGPLQYMHARDTDLTVFQQAKVNKVLIDKDSLYTQEGTAMVAASPAVIGTVVPYEGDYGISNQPESFAFYGFRRYFTDVDRGAVMRLSRDGLTEISQYGMSDYFRDRLSEVNNNYKIWQTTVACNTPSGVSITAADVSDLQLGMRIQFNNPTNQVAFIVGIDPTVNRVSCSDTILDTPTEFTARKNVKDKILAGWDAHSKNYVLSIQISETSPQQETRHETLNFDDGINGWVSFQSFVPDQIRSLKNVFYSFKGSGLWQHYNNQARNNFYGVSYDSCVEFIFNQRPSVTKNFSTVSYEGYNGWEVESFKSSETGIESGSFNSDTTKSISSYDEGVYIDSVTGYTLRAGFDRKENLYVANLISSTPSQPGEIIFGDQISGIKGYFATVKIKTDSTTDPGGHKELFSVGTRYVQSS